MLLSEFQHEFRDTIEKQDCLSIIISYNSLELRRLLRELSGAHPSTE